MGSRSGRTSMPGQPPPATENSSTMATPTPLRTSAQASSARTISTVARHGTLARWNAAATSWPNGILRLYSPSRLRASSASPTLSWRASAWPCGRMQTIWPVANGSTTRLGLSMGSTETASSTLRPSNSCAMSESSVVWYFRRTRGCSFT
ncbi:Uncharacterised protein [Bordetella pertussis]|nr:Uncharacterised protein [Bordetella pertussis]